MTHVNSQYSVYLYAVHNTFYCTLQQYLLSCLQTMVRRTLLLSHYVMCHVHIGVRFILCLVLQYLACQIAPAYCTACKTHSTPLFSSRFYIQTVCTASAYNVAHAEANKHTLHSSSTCCNVGSYQWLLKQICTILHSSAIFAKRVVAGLVY
jgi:hypothetical protein